MVGEHIRALKGGRWVHGIDCGDQTVLHLAEQESPRRVRRVYRPEFVSGAESVERVTHRERTFAPREVVRRAYSRAADPALAAMFGDSEAFAAWCTTGRLVEPRNVALAAPSPTAAAPAAPPAARSAPRREKRRTARPKAARPKKAVARKAKRVRKGRARKPSPAARAKTVRRPPKKTAARKRRRR